jgi:DNA-binding NtrC family response regulator
VVARLLHAYSQRAKAPFVAFNCTSSPKDMLDSQLFGHRRGAFTGAIEHAPGIVRSAERGTLLLDEVGDMPLDLQPKLLRFLESGEVHPVGEARPSKVDVRIIAATNTRLETLIAKGLFREDLYYRLNIVEVRLPPLRERRADIPPLANHYLKKGAAENRKGDLRLAEDTMEYLLLYQWPGNVRQLANEMRRLAVMAESGATLMPEHLSTDIAASRRTVPAAVRPADPREVTVRLDQPLAAMLEHVERTAVQRALAVHEGNLEGAAAMLGLTRKGLYLKRQRYGFEFRPGSNS